MLSRGAAESSSTLCRGAEFSGSKPLHGLMVNIAQFHPRKGKTGLRRVFVRMTQRRQE